MASGFRAGWRRCSGEAATCEAHCKRAKGNSSIDVDSNDSFRQVTDHADGSLLAER
jgi:hypothetical protein